MANYRIEIQHYLQNALPKDKWVNVIYANTSGDPAALANGIKTTFFAGTNGFSAYTGFYGTVNVYDMAAAEPRPIVATSSYVPSSPWTASSLFPEQVALCLSYYATRNLPSQRGRIYIGPWISLASPNNVPSSTIIGELISLATDLHAGGTGVGYVQQLYSPKLGTFSPITNYWVDNEWDTQRRRLTAATGRTKYP